MSKKEQTVIKCHKCGKEGSVELWTSLNTSSNPEAKKDLLEGRINLFQCLDCNSEATVPVSFLYHDMENDYCIWHFPFEETEHIDFYDNFTTRGKIKSDSDEDFLPEPSYMKDAQIVFSMDELRRHVIFRDNLYKAKSEKKANINAVQAGFNIVYLLTNFHGKINENKISDIKKCLHFNFRGDVDIESEITLINSLNHKEKSKRFSDAVNFMKDTAPPETRMRLMDFALDLIAEDKKLSDDESKFFEFLRLMLAN